MMEFFSGTIVRRILAGMMLVALVPVAIVAYQGYHCARQAVVAETRSKLFEITRQRRARIDDWFQERRSDLDLLSHMSCLWQACCDLARADEPKLTDYVCNCLASFRRRSPSYEGIAMVDAELRPLAKVGQVLPAQAPPSFRKALVENREPTFGPLQRTSDGGFLLYAGMMGQGDLGTGKYVLARLSLDKAMRRILEDTDESQPATEVFLVSTGGVLLGSSRRAHQNDRPTPGESLGLERALAGKNGADVYRNAQGREVVGAYLWMPAQQWALLAEMDTREAFAWLRVLRFRALTTASVTLVAIFLVARLLARTLSAPLGRLAEAAWQVGRGDLSQSVPPGGGVEVNAVAHAFNHMVRDLERSRQELMRASALAAVGELSASIVHEMRNPLSSIKMNLQALRRQVEGDAVHQELADIAFSQVDRIARMLTELLDFGKPVELDRKPDDLQRVLDEAMATCRPSAAERQISFRRKFPAELPPVRIDGSRMQQVFVNLLRNAIEASPPGGEAQVVVRPNRDADEIVVEIVDAGSGIAPEAAERIFEPFFSTKEHGTGLGLANVRKIVELHDGRVEAENRPEGGAVFRVHLPAWERP